MKNQIDFRVFIFYITFFTGLFLNGCTSKKESKTEALSGQGKLQKSEITVCHKSGKPSSKMFVTKIGSTVTYAPGMNPATLSSTSEKTPAIPWPGEISDLKASSWDIQLTLTCLQGLVNRDTPSLFIAQDELDEKWLKWMEERGDISEVEWVSVGQIIEKFAPIAQGIVIVDTLIPATFNVGTMLAGIKNWLVATPEVLKGYSLEDKISKHSGNDVLDLRQFHWKNDVEAYRWFYEKYYDQLSHRMCAVTDPYDLPLRDYLVEFRIPLFWVNSGLDREEMTFTEGLLMKLPPNIPCLGWPTAWHQKELSPDEGIDEQIGQHIISEYAKFLLATGSDGASRAVSNLSVHSGTTAGLNNLNHTLPLPDLENKIYISFIRTDGDGLNFYKDRYRKLWDDTTTHGKFAMGWQQAPTLFDLMPDVVDWYYQHATPNDYFVNSLTGIGYIHENLYAYMYPVERQKQIWKEYLQLSKAYREKTNLSMLTTFMDMSPERTADFASIGYRGIFYNYYRTYNTSLNNQLSEMNGVPVFHTMANGGNSARLVDEIRLWTPRHRPAFVYVSLSNWVTSLKPIEEALKELGPEYVAVTPEQLVGLYWKSRKK